MKITKIAVHSKTKNRYAIFIDNAYSFSLSDQALLEAKLIPGQELTKQEVDRFMRTAAEDSIYSRTLRYAALRPHSVWEIKQYLQKKGSPPPLIEQITNKLIQIGLLDDAVYAASYIHDRQLLRPASRRKITLELHKKHVSKEVIAAALGAETTSGESTALADIIATKRRQGKYQDERKLMQYLARQGFSYSDIKTALLAEHEYD